MAKTKSRAQRRKARQRKKLALGLGIGGVAVLLVGYTGLCIAASGEKLLPNTIVLGTDLGGMTRTEAENTIRQQVAEEYADKNLRITVGEQAVSLPVSGFVEVDADLAVDQAFTLRQPSNFIQGGGAYLKALLTDTTVDAAGAVTFTNLDQVYDQLAQVISATDQAAIPTSYQLTDSQIIFTKGTSGWTVDQAGLQEAVLTALEDGNFDDPIQCPLEVTAPEAFDLDAVYDAVFTRPENATCNSDGTVASSVQGVSFDVDTAKARLDAAEEGAQIPIDLTLTDPEITTEQLQELLFRDLLGTASSNVGGSSSRKSNVAKVAEYIDGTILNPGETFSYNNVVGERTTARGFQEAPSYVSGETVNTVGGGVCQGSSTVYLAALRANMEIVERHSHSFLCSYMPYGQDATVSWGTLDFQFRNDTDYPVKIRMSYADSKLTVSIYGTNLTGNYVEITNQVNSTTNYSTVYEETTELAAGVKQTKTTGYNGMSVTVYRNIYDKDGNLLSTTVENNSTYKVRNQVILVGVSKASTESPTTSTSPSPSTSTEPSPSPSESPAASESPAQSEAPAPESPSTEGEAAAAQEE
jgi:vancomycin resistance protein YoaR